MSSKYPQTPDGRYFVARNRLWRCTDPRLSEDTRRLHVKALMKARRAVRSAQQHDDEHTLRQARQAVQEAKEALGERGLSGGRMEHRTKAVSLPTTAPLPTGGPRAPEAWCVVICTPLLLHR